ncbi:MAG: paraquat-inducible protein A [Deltaproteobacteria bacterium]|nr:paraquat-inducible protein A [Deltaproteobacteria bacterium]
MRAQEPVSGTCPRCGERIHRRKPRSIMRPLAFLVAAVALYWPANTLPMMVTDQFPVHRSDTILSGVAFLWSEGSWLLAALVFTASFVVPMLKVGALGTLLVTSARRSAWQPRGRTKVYRVLEIVGHWSMLDVFVVALLAAVVQLGRFASVEPGPAVVPFAGVVLLTMLASASFDPRSIWDHLGARSVYGRE